MKVLIDGDVPRYECGFSAETPIWEVQVNGQDGILASFRYKKELDEFLGTMGFRHDEVTIINRKDIGPVSHALHGVKELIRAILARTNADDYQVYITGEGNFREDVAKILPYKGNRDKSHKPHHYDKITKYMVENWGAQEVMGIEADDALGIEQYEDWKRATNPMNPLIKSEGKSTAETNLRTCIATIDKDLDMIPGWHYNWRKDVMYFVDDHTAITWFYCQLIMGDKQVDNIQGIPGAGKKKAYNVLKDCETEKEMYEATLEAYKEYIRKKFKKLEDDITEKEVDILAYEELLENARLLWMLREPLEPDRSNLWTPPDA